MDKPDIVEAACSRAWSVYLLINNGIDESDARRGLLESFSQQRWEAGVGETELLVVEGLKHLKKLDGSLEG